MDKYIGIPFVLGGREYTGCDCYGLVRLFYEDYFNIILPKYDLYKQFDSILLYTLIDCNKSLLDFEQIDKPEFGDVGLYNFYGNPTHLTIYIGNDKILHIMRGTDSVIEKYNSPRLRGRFNGWYHKKR